jgi:hypothetical protein
MVIEEINMAIFSMYILDEINERLVFTDGLYVFKHSVRQVPVLLWVVQPV